MWQPVVIVGCTASGKSALAEALAVRLGVAGKPATIMAVDSMQVYRRMDIGTAKPDAATRERIPHVMIDVAEPWEAYSAARFAQDARPILDAHRAAEKPLVLVGGTIFYVRALLEGLFEGPAADEKLRAELEAEAALTGVPALHAKLSRVDPVAAERIHPNDLRRIVRALEVFHLTGKPISELQTQWNRDHPAIVTRFFGVQREKEALNRRINTRVRHMLEAGLLEEVLRLKDDPQGFSQEAGSGVGYRQLLDFLARRCSLEEAVEQIKIQTRHLAKLQRTWLKRFTNVTWLPAGDDQSGAELAEQVQAMLHAESRT